MRALPLTLTLTLTLAAAGCGDLFKTFAPEGYACSPTGSCPPGQQCVPNERICRTPCTQTNVVGTTGGMGGANQQCADVHQNNQNGGTVTGYACDYDHFCRPSCATSGNGCSGCSGTDLCDSSVGVCRPACGDGCPASWGCVASTGSGNVMPPMICNICRPLASSTFLPPTFAPIVYYATGVNGQHTSAVAVGDLTGNGRPSVIAIDEAAQKIYVYGNNGDGTLTPPTALSPGGHPYHAAVVDLDHDGKADVVLAATPQPLLLAGNGDGTLAAPRLGPTIPTTDLVAGDFDNDGKPDVAFCGAGTRVLNLVSADGAGGFKVIASFTSPNNGASFVHVGAADFNGDKKLDLYADDQSGSLVPFLNPGGAGFSFMQGPTANFVNRIDSTAFDADGDGKPDIVSLMGSAPAGMTSTSFWILVIGGSGTGGFTGGMQTPLPGANAIAAGDFDGDRRIDAAVANQAVASKNAVEIASGTGTGLAWSATLSVMAGPSSIAVADLDGDGRPEIIAGGRSTHNVRIYLNRGTALENQPAK
ncbi:MAG: FG-GAP repeat domain-containing protein [Polyangia bacterium]